MSLGTVNAYGGSNAGIYSNTAQTIGLCGTLNTQQRQLNILEFNGECPTVPQHGSNLVFELETDRRIPENVNISLCTGGLSAPDVIEFASNCPEASILHGTQLFLELSGGNRRLGMRYDLGLCCYYERPPNCDVVFNLGAEKVIVYAEGEPPGSYDIRFESENEINESVHNVYWTGDAQIDRLDYCDSYHGIHTSSCEIDLTTDQPDGRHNDLTLCGLGDPGIVPTPQELETFESHEWTYNLDDDLPCPSDFRHLHQFGSDLLVSLDVEKNLNWDLKLCPSDFNPPADYSEEDPHNFYHELDYDYECAVLEFDVYHGHNGTVEVGISLDIDIDPIEHGHNGEFELATTQVFDCDAYGGAYGDCDFTDFPSAEIDADAYGGHNVDWSLATVSLMEADGYGGGYGDADLTDFPAAELEADGYGGHNGDVEILTEPNIQDADAYHGGHGEDFELTIFPAIELELDSYAGHNTESDLLVTPQFSGDAYHGGYGDGELETFESEGLGDIDGYHGHYGEGELAPQFALYPDAYHGSYGDFDLATVTTLEGDAYGGAYGECDFTEVPPPELPGDAYHGSLGELDGMSLTSALFPRGYGGATGDADLTDFPAAELDIEAYHGGYGDGELDFDTFLHQAYAGSYGDLDLAIQVNMPADGYNGHNTESDLSTETTFDVDGYFGSTGELDDIEVPPGEAIEAIAYGGAHVEAGSDGILIYQQFKVHIRAGYACYDGFGGPGGINFCPQEEGLTVSNPWGYSAEDPAQILRFTWPRDSQNIAEYDTSGNNFEFMETGFRVWNPCSESHGMGHMTVDLLTRPRFQVENYHGSSIEMYMSRELQGLCAEEIDGLYLYSENGEGGRQDHIDNPRLLGIEFEFDVYHGSSVLAWWDADADPAEINFGYHGANLDAELWTYPYQFEEVDAGIHAEVLSLSVDTASWKFCYPEFADGSNVNLDFEPVCWMRFCPGYVIPTGSSVVLDFGSADNEDCEVIPIKTGASVTIDKLVTFQNFQTEFADGSNLGTWLLVDPIISIVAYHGHNTTVINPEIELEFPHGSSAAGEFFEPPYIGYHGSAAEIDELSVAGAAVEWVTESGCLPNEYIPLTEDGDPCFVCILPDEHGVVHYPDIPVEGLPYYSTLLAECITFVET